MKLDKSVIETPEMLREAFGEHSLSRTVVFEWHSRFKAGQVSVEDNDHSGQPSTGKTTENVEKIRQLINEASHRIIHELADTVGISYGVCQEVLTENLNMCRTAAKFVPRLLTNDQKQVCLEL
jgi:ATP-dependent Zn protease